VAESCSGTSGACPSDGFQPATTPCTGTSNGGPCDGTDSCSGTANTCVDGFKSATTTCRQSAGDCDVAESCNGTTGACPADGFKTATTTCRPAAGDCDEAESCTGSSAACPADTGDECDFRDNPQIAPTGTTCQQFRSNTSGTLASELYTLTKGNPAAQTINSISPGVFFLYDGVHLGATGTILVTQSDGIWTRVIGVQQLQVILYNLSCTVQHVGTLTVNAATGNVTIANVPAGDYILSVKYDPGTLIGYHPPSTSTTYNFAVTAGGMGSGSASVLVNKKK
jgi:hypothetical protein